MAKLKRRSFARNEKAFNLKRVFLIREGGQADAYKELDIHANQF